jgi:hypothetical protein
MNITAIAIFGAMLEVVASGAPWQTILVCVENGSVSEDEREAEAIASRIFLPALVRLEWHSDARSCRNRPDRIVEISFATHATAGFGPAALAYALPCEGRHIVVFYHRFGYLDPALVPKLLAHVMAHEITHLLQGISQHSEQGIMKARWENRDLAMMKLKPLDFTPKDLQLIREGLAGYARDRIPRTQLAGSELTASEEIACK